MRSMTSGSITTLMMFIPLTAIPLLAVFGIPEFAPVSASPSEEDEELFAELGQPIHLGESARYTPDDLFASFASGDDSSVSGRANSSTASHRDDGWLSEDPFVNWDDSPTTAASRSPGRANGETRALPEDALRGWALDEPREAEQFALLDEAGADRSGRGSGRSSQNSRRGSLSSRSMDADFDLEATQRMRAAADLFADRGSFPNHEAATHADTPNADIVPVSKQTDSELFADVSSGTSPQPSGSGREFEDMPVPQPIRYQQTSAARDAEPPPMPATGRMRRPVEPAEPLTWRGAVKRLNELGIRHYLLQPGERDGEFHFSCYFTPRDNPRITHRFEAEATEPLRAVQKVLDQIEHWLELR